ncbi:MAG: 30S ribosomal protein S17 [Parcubacteria group bacterium]|nr:30S ribosomal protein S17 [Parcubacteria group bacterium]MBI2049081.1 30S ribosomal protein S17 [Parcubacteria group bacterium]
MKQPRNKKRLKGIVVRNSTNKTAVVEITSFKISPKYKKYVKSSKRFKAHDEKNECKIGDTVLIEETRPISKEKHFRIVHDTNPRMKNE